MDFRELYIKSEYRSLHDNIITDFFNPILDKSTLYKRAVGFFSSSALIQITYGLTKLIKNDGKILLIASPRLQAEDIEAMKIGYEARRKVIEKSILDSIREPTNFFEEERLNLLATLISEGRLDIKLAFTEKNDTIGMYHEKLGLLYDSSNNIIAFTGSMNETSNAFLYNYESIDVFCSWTKDKERVMLKEEAFETLWSNKDSNVEIIEFPKVAYEKLKSYKKEKIDIDMDNRILQCADIKQLKPLLSEPMIPAGFSFHDYQIEAIDNWEKQDFVGIFDMATGTGKTYTGLGALERLYQTVKGQLAVVIVCPYQHLVEQWVEDINKFNIKPIIGYSSSPQRDWRRKLESAVRDQKIKVRGSSFFCFICTNATFSSDFVQRQISKIRGNALLLVDEAHNFGSTKLSTLLSENFNYRLALSATLERHNDEEGTEKLYKYFGNVCIKYTLDMAISEGKLTPYKYYPVLVSLNEKELQLYSYLSQEIAKCLIQDKTGKVRLNEKGEKLALKRSRLVAAASDKIELLRELISPYKNDNYMLVYCGATTLLPDNQDYSDVDIEDIRQIDAVTKMLGNDLEMKVSQFTSREDAEEREILKHKFQRADNLQALIAIKCLDEGVNIPSIKTAFILASTTNPKEYIQRRGRVLRLAKGKDYAEIFDFVTTPRPLDEVSSLTEDVMKKELGLVKNELKRVIEFARLAMNYMEADKIIQSIIETYNLEIDELYYDN